jgi:hypothetical protein
MFQKGRYQDVVALLAGKKNNELSDSMFLILCGSLIIVEPSKLGEYLFSRTIRDGYHHYLRGRFYYLNGKWEQARTCFLKALTIRTIIPCDESTLYFLVNSAFNLYQRTPNISNREFFEGQKNEYLVKYCEKSENTNCMVVQNLMLK